MYVRQQDSASVCVLVCVCVSAYVHVYLHTQCVLLSPASVLGPEGRQLLIPHFCREASLSVAVAWQPIPGHSMGEYLMGPGSRGREFNCIYIELINKVVKIALTGQHLEIDVVAVSLRLSDTHMHTHTNTDANTHENRHTETHTGN